MTEYFSSISDTDSPFKDTHERTPSFTSNLLAENQVWDEFEADNDTESLNSNGSQPAPPAVTRSEFLMNESKLGFLHGGPALHAVSAPEQMIAHLSTTARKVTTTTSWRAFTDVEEEGLRRAWEMLREAETPVPQGTSNDALYEKDNAVDEEDENTAVADRRMLDKPHIVAVGLDRLFSVNLKTLLLQPDFWTGSSVTCLRSSWFYAPAISSAPFTPGYLRKTYLVDVVLAGALEDAYGKVKPWRSNYPDFLASASEEELSAVRIPLLHEVVGAESEEGNPGTTENHQIAVVFQDAEIGRIYSTTYLGVVERFSGYNSGQIVLRGWTAVEKWNHRDNSRPPHSEPLKVSPPSVVVELESQPESTGFLASLKTRLGGSSFRPPDSTVERPPISLSQGSSSLNSTEEAINADPGVLTDELGEVDELVLVIHGTGQKLAGIHETFNFVHAVNHLRTNCNLSAASLALRPLLKTKRVQFIPVRWRADLVFDDIAAEAENQGEEGEHLNNHFSLEDSKISGIPIVRAIVDGMLDIPYYQSPHKAKMLAAVVAEANKIFLLFTTRNPQFQGKVSIIAHSLGSTLVNDILSTQPTFVKELKDMSEEEKISEVQFIFDTRCLFLVGSPLAFFLHLHQGQLIARAGRKRSKNVGKDIALDRPRYGCLAIDSIYNIYFETDPVAYMLNNAVDSTYAKLIQAIEIPSNSRSIYERLSTLFNVSSIFSTPAPKSPTTSTAPPIPSPLHSHSTSYPPDVKRPVQRLKRMPSEQRSLEPREFEILDRAERRFKALNPQGNIDFVLPGEGVNQYLDALTSHGDYWYDKRLAEFVLLQLFSEEAELGIVGREEVGLEFQEDREGDNGEGVTSVDSDRGVMSW